MRRLYAWLAGFAGGAAVYRAFRRAPAPVSDPAAELKAKLAEAKAAGDDRRDARRVSGTIAREELRDRLEELTLVETQPRNAFRRFHLPGALNLPKHRVDELAPVLLPDLDAEIVVYCGSWVCRTSDRVAERLRRLGYTRVRIYRGGKADWRRAGLPTVRSA